MDAMTELEERLVGPEGEALRAELIQRCTALEARLHSRMTAGLTREVFLATQSASEAARAAIEVLSRAQKA